MHSATPSQDENAPPMQSPFDRASETLRSLREDIVIFQDPSVRNYLETIPTNPDIPPPSPSRSPEELHAVIIALRTRLNDTIDALNETKSANLESRKRAARAEGHVRELERQLSEREALHDAAVRDASARIEGMERDRLEGRARAEQEALRVREDAERRDVGSRTLSAERAALAAERDALRETVAALRRDLAAAERGRAADVTRAEADAALHKERVALLERELGAHRAGTAEVARLGTDELSSARALAERLQHEAVGLKSDLQWRTTQATRLQARMDEAEASLARNATELDDARFRLDSVRVLEEEVKLLRVQTRDKENVSGHVAALTREKIELTQLICALSPTGDAEEGLRLLRDAGNGGSLPSRRGSRGRQPLGVRLEETIAELRKDRDGEVGRLGKEVNSWKMRAREAEKQLMTAQNERDAALVTNKRNERMRRVLHKENGHLRAALDEFEKEEGDMPGATTDARSALLKSRLQASERSIADYKTAVTELENTVTAMTRDIAVLKLRTVESENPQVTGEADAGALEELRKKLLDATNAATEAQEAKSSAESTAKDVTARLTELESELTRLKLERHDSDHQTEDGPPDFDPSTTKVLHIDDNPLLRAMKKAAAERESAKGKKRLRVDADVEQSPVRAESDKKQVAELVGRIAELTKLNESLDRASKVGMRTKEIALKKIEEVRSAVYNIFGWSMKVMGAKYIVSSIYAEGPREELEFGLNESGTMSLHETEYAARLSEEIDQYVHRMNSFPALLAHVTMENFEKTTAAL